ncbi:diacylglycerol kinase [Clostridiisalibacter paucivorans]|uniref:diacylglycerol kinase n=1 Tax=Clostridiisalibacter paucivorans TaxID=408753 RepID=UPI00047A5094|nr:diacylglycerol kinase [Clostridiisalibacter paucivorans]
MRVRKLIDSFNYAVEGIIYTLKTQRNMRIHTLAAFLVLFFSLFINFSRVELIILFFTISLVVITEMINTAIEKAIDIYTKEYHPLAKIAKNVAAGAVLVSAINAIIVAYLLMFDRVNPYTHHIITKIKQIPIHLTFISLVIVTIITIVIKSTSKQGTAFKGGIISGHAAISFAISTSITFITENTLVATLTFFSAFLVAQSRIEGKIHSTLQVILGGIIGIIITVIIFQAFG